MSAAGYAAKEQTCAWEEVTSPLAPFVLTRVHDWLSRLCAAMASAEALRSTLPQMSQTATMYGKLATERHVLCLGLAAGAVCGGLHTSKRRIKEICAGEGACLTLNASSNRSSEDANAKLSGGALLAGSFAARWLRRVLRGGPAPLRL